LQPALILQFVILISQFNKKPLRSDIGTQRLFFMQLILFNNLALVDHVHDDLCAVFNA